MKSLIIPFALSLLLLVAALLTGFGLVWTLFYLSLLGIVIGLLWVYLGLRGLKVQIDKLPRSSQVGKWFNRNITVSNGSRLPEIIVTVKDSTRLPGKERDYRAAVDSNRSINVPAGVLCTRRGRYEIGPMVASITDPFGVLHLSRSFGVSQQIVVYPETIELPSFSPFPADTSLARVKRWMGSGISSNASRVREYVAGDSMHRIHWRSTARTGQTMVKVFDPERSVANSVSICVVLNMQQDVHVKRGGLSTEELSITVAASLVKKYSDSGIPVGLLAAAETDYFSPPEHGDKHFNYLMESLAVMKAAGQTPLEDVISGNYKYFANNATLIVISPSIDPGVSLCLRNLMNRGNTVVFILLESTRTDQNADSEPLLNQLKGSGVQVYSIKADDEIAKSLGRNVYSSQITI